jgi:hypothetical protein
MKRITLEYRGTMIISETPDGTPEIFVDGESIASDVLYLLDNARQDRIERTDAVVTVSFAAPGVFDEPC